MSAPRPDPLADLGTLCGEDLSPELHDRLARLVIEARKRQQREVQLAIDSALTHIPALLRGAVRKLLFKR